MALSLSGPVGDKNRITKPDPKQKSQKFKAVSNKPADVELVQLMLVANGHDIEVDGKCGSGTVKAIRAFQKSALGYAKPDGIVDPDEKTWKAGLPKLQAKIKADEKAVEDMVLVREGGKEKMITREEFDRGESELKRKVISKANMMYGQAESWLDFCKDAEATIQGADGFMQSMVEFGVRWANSKAEPPYDALTDARGEASLLKALVDRSKVDWEKVHKQDQKATAAYNKGVKAFETFIEARIGTASKIAGRLETVRDISFTVVEAYATAQFVARGRTPAQAHAMAAGGTEALKSSANQLGEYLASNKPFDFKKAGQAVLIDSITAAVAGAAGGKLTGGFAKSAQHSFALKLAPMFKSAAGKKVVGVVCTKLLDNPAVQGAITQAAKESVGLLRKKIENGSVTEKEVYEAILKSASGGLASLVPVKVFLGFEAKSPEFARKLVAEKLAPAVGKRVEYNLLMKGVDVTDDMMKKLSNEIYIKIAEEVNAKATEIMVTGAANAMTSKEPEGGLVKLGEQELRRNTELQKEIEARIEKEVLELVKKAEKKK